MNVKSFDEMLMILNAGREEYNGVLSQLEQIDINYKINDDLRRAELVNKLQHINYVLTEETEAFISIIDEATTFERQQLLSFLCEYLTLTEQKEIVATKVGIRHYESDDLAEEISRHTMRSRKEVEDLQDKHEDMEEDGTINYYFVSDKIVAKKIEDTFSEENDSLQDLLDRMEDEQYLLLGKKQIHVAECLALKEKYLIFPQLKSVFKRLVDLYLQHPEYSENARMAVIIKETKGRNLFYKY